MPAVVVTLSSPFGRSLLSVSLARADSSFMNTSCAVRKRRSPCSVRISPRAWRWNSETLSSVSSALTWRDTADCDRPRCSPAWVKLPASAAAWKTFSLSQSIALNRCVAAALSPSRQGGEATSSLRRHGRFGFAVGGEKFLHFQRGHAALTGGGHRLAVDVVGDVA